MNIAMLIAFMFCFAIANRARGSRLFDTTTSTVLGRIVSMLVMAMACSIALMPDTMKMVWELAFAFPALMMWCTPAWDAYWSAEIGNDAAHSRWWGLMAMTLRMGLIVPFLAGSAIIAGHPVNMVWGFGFLLMGLPYLIYSCLTKNPIEYAEYTIGAMLGLFACGALGL